ncbi:hypothetical protein [Clostridium niameyense]|nr:hypothetical protein [Clostridium niameyense]
MKFSNCRSLDSANRGYEWVRSAISIIDGGFSVTNMGYGELSWVAYG